MSQFCRYLSKNFRTIASPADVLRSQSAAAIQGEDKLYVGYHAYTNAEGKSISMQFAVPSGEIDKFLCLGEDRAAGEILQVFPTDVPAPMIQAVREAQAATTQRDLAFAG